MFRDDHVVIEPMISTWQPPRSHVAVARAPVIVDAFANDEIGAVWHVYREIAQRIPRKAYTRHASKLGKASR